MAFMTRIFYKALMVEQLLVVVKEAMLVAEVLTLKLANLKMVNSNPLIPESTCPKPKIKNVDLLVAYPHCLTTRSPLPMAHRIGKRSQEFTKENVPY